jgi:putative flippase GtrA
MSESGKIGICMRAKIPDRSGIRSGELFREAWAYFAISIVALAVDVSILWILARCLSWWYLPAAAASFCAGAVVAYMLSISVVFRTRRMKDAHSEFASFFALGVFGLIINFGAIWLFVTCLGMHILLGKILATGFTFVYNFVSRKHFLFVERSHG